jgi:uracil-DNA glycosylase family protein
MKVLKHHPAERLPPDVSYDEAKSAAADCRACGLWKNATQTVFGAGAVPAAIVLVGEQPGDQEDRAGQPFVGPAGQVLREALEAVGLDPRHVYVTNAVKHFKWIPRGKRRIHAKPVTSEILACRPWLLLELSMVKAQAVVCLGATAARAVLGKTVTIGTVRGRPLQSAVAPLVFVTTHPSSILRAPDSESRAQARAAFQADLRQVAAALAKL